MKIEKEFITYRGGRIDRLKIKPKMLIYVLKEVKEDEEEKTYGRPMQKV